MAAPGADSIVTGLAVAAGSLVLDMLGVEPRTVFLATAACCLGAPFAAPAGSWPRAVIRFVASVVVTCHAAAGIAVVLGVWMPAWSPHHKPVQALAAIVIGVLMHIVLSHAPDLIKAIAKRMAHRLAGGQP